MDPSPEPVAVLILSIAAFFRDDIHGVIGNNIFALTPKSSLIHDLDSSKYSLKSREWVNPRIIEDLVGWISDSGDQIVSVNIAESNNSNRYFGTITHDESTNGFPRVTSTHDGGWFSYQYLGKSFSGVHLIRTWSNGGGTGIFCDVVMVTLSLDTFFGHTGKKKNRFVIKLIGSLPLGDRYEGEVSYKFGILTIPACQGMKTLRETKSRLLIL